MHMNTEHREDQQNEPKTIQCEVCSKQFPSQQSLIAHRVCHRDSNLLCTVCGNKYKSNATLLAHISTHKEKTFACEQCPITFKTRKSLRYHRLVHAGLKPYKCDFCERTFRCSTHLKSKFSLIKPKTQQKNTPKPCSPPECAHRSQTLPVFRL